MPTINRTCQTNLVIVSDHGFTTFDYKGHLNRWLIERGYLVPGKEGETGSLKEIDWASSKAYAVGLNSLYLNLEGRENQGCVSAKDKHCISLRIRDELMAW
jgi:predicted AlkP superfamily phosphohydrolase/phosphomutase